MIEIGTQKNRLGRRRQRVGNIVYVRVDCGLEAIHLRFNSWVTEKRLYDSHAAVGEKAYLYCSAVRGPWSLGKSKLIFP